LPDWKNWRRGESIDTFRIFNTTALDERTSLRTIVACCLAGFLATTALQGQTARLSGTLILRSQAGSVAEETLGKLGSSLKGLDQMNVSVEGGSVRTLIENAFVELLNRQGIHTSLQPAQAVGKRALQVTVLEQGVRYVGLSTGEYRREVRTSVEARDLPRDSSLMQYLGIFSRVDVDTVAFREEIGFSPLARESERTLFDKLVGPVLLIGGAFLVVYLFFTVRN
jgi:hypothetical protein